jgi:putative transposase
MPNYRRIIAPGATFFFTVNCASRDGNRILVDHIELLRASFRVVKQRHPFEIDAMVVLPEHLHCIWTLPPGDADYATRWGLIKAGFSRALPPVEGRSKSREKRGERGLWQRRYWEHMIRDDGDYARHLDYIHWNPVKHGWVEKVADWPYSSFHRYVLQGILPADWAGAKAEIMTAGE